MKVTVLIPDKLVGKLESLVPGNTITDSIVGVLKEWVASKELSQIGEQIKKRPFNFSSKRLLRKYVG